MIKTIAMNITVTQIKEVCKNIEKKNDLSLLIVNARSLYKKNESLHDLLNSIDIELKIMGLVETWLKEPTSSVLPY